MVNENAAIRALESQYWNAEPENIMNYRLKPPEYSILNCICEEKKLTFSSTGSKEPNEMQCDERNYVYTDLD